MDTVVRGKVIQVQCVEGALVKLQDGASRVAYWNADGFLFVAFQDGMDPLFGAMSRDDFDQGSPIGLENYPTLYHRDRRIDLGIALEKLGAEVVEV